MQKTLLQPPSAGKIEVQPKPRARNVPIPTLIQPTRREVPLERPLDRPLVRIAAVLARPAVFLTLTVLLALAIRLIVVAFCVPEVAENTFDHNAFGWEMGWTARSLFLHQGFSSPFNPVGTGPTALVPPIYPWLISIAFRLFGLYTPAAAWAVLGFNSVCSALTCIPLFFLTRNVLTPRLARSIAFAWAVYPFAIYFSADRVWDYALTALLFTTCLLLAQRLHLRGPLAWIAFGALYALTVLNNPSVLTLLPILLVIALFKLRGNGRPWFLKAALTTLAFFAVVTPWNIRNQHALHQSFFLRDGFWLEFYAGNNGDLHESNSAWAHPASNAHEMQKYITMGEIPYIAEKHTLATAFVRTHPTFVAVATLRRIVRFWTGYWSFAPSYLRFEPLDLPCVPFNCFLVFFMLRGLRRWWHDYDGAVLPYLAAVLLFPLPYYLTHASMDYRQPLEPILLILVVVGLRGTSASRQRAQDSEDAHTIHEPQTLTA